MSQNVAFKPLAISCALIIRIERRVHMDREPAAVIANRKHRQQRSTGGTGPSPGVADNINFAMEKTDRLTVLLGPANTDRGYMIVLKVAVQSLHGDCRALRIEHYPRAETLILGNGFTRLSQTIPNRGDENPWRG